MIQSFRPHGIHNTQQYLKPPQLFLSTTVPVCNCSYPRLFLSAALPVFSCSRLDLSYSNFHLISLDSYISVMASHPHRSDTVRSGAVRSAQAPDHSPVRCGAEGIAPHQNQLRWGATLNCSVKKCFFYAKKLFLTLQSRCDYSVSHSHRSNLRPEKGRTRTAPN
jgi:hypothetical protein